MGYKQQIKQLIQKYGKLAIGIHLALSVMSYTGCYIFANTANLNSDTFKKYFLKNQEQKEGSTGVKTLSTYAAAYIIYKALMPIRIPLTISVVGLITKLKKI